MTESECIVSGTLATVLRVSRLAGLAPLTFARQKDGWRVSVSPPISYLGYILIVIIYAFIFSAIVVEINIQGHEGIQKKTFTESLVCSVDSILMLIIIYLAISGSRRRMEAMITCLNYQQKINNQLNIKSWPHWFEKKKMVLFVIVMMVIIMFSFVEEVIVLVIFILEGIVELYYVNVMYLFYYISYWIMKLQEIQFIMITLHVLYTFKKINDNLRSILQELSELKKSVLLPWINRPYDVTYKRLSGEVTSFTSSTDKLDSDECIKSPAEKVRTLSWCLPTTCDVVREVDRTYGVVLFFILGYYFYHLVMTPFFFVNNMISTNRGNNAAKDCYDVLQLLWCIVHAIGFISVMEPCHMIQMEMEATRSLVSHVMCAQQSAYEPLAVQLELFYKQLVLNHVSFSPLSVTKLSRALVATMFGSITTYLVVIIGL